MNVMHAPRGGTDLFGHHYNGGQFLPFYVPRPHMPQVDEADLPRLVRDDSGCAFDVLPVCTLRVHQRIDHRRAQEMAERIKRKPVLVSSDGYVVDGNHRWWAHVSHGDQWINVIRLSLPFTYAINWLLTRPYVYRLTPDTPERN